MFHVQNLTCEGRINPLGIDERSPRLSWQLNSKESVVQSAYRIQVFRESDEKPFWDSGKVNSKSSVLVPYEGPALSARTRYFWRVCAWDQKGRETDFSEKAWWETGLIVTAGFSGGWITQPNQGDFKKMQPVPMFRRSFTLRAGAQRARVYASALGTYQMYINSQPVSGDVLSPGWTSYSNRVQYQTYDVTALLHEGENVIAVTLGDGWYRGYIGGGDNRAKYGSKLGLICQMNAVLEDGSEAVLCADEKWKVFEDGPIRYADHYQGICYDARMEIDGWMNPGFDDSAWKNAAVLNEKKSLLTAQICQPVRRIMTLKPRSIITTPKGETVIDMGQNMVGWLKFKVRGEAGHTVSVQHGEVLDKDGNFYNENYRSAKSEIIYTLKGDGEEVFEPQHTFFGFQYVKLENWCGEVRKEDFEGIVICTDMEITSGFECSDERVNQLFTNIQWGQRGNFVDVPTDCPQRDERLGWTGDCQVFARTACINMDSHMILTKWLGDLALDQSNVGSIPHVVPRVFSNITNNYGSAAWGDAATIVPWTLYQCYGDRRILEKQYRSMRRWLEFIDSQSNDYLWDTGKHFGDWLGLDAYEGSYVGATEKALIATAYSAYSTHLTMKTAEVLGLERDAAELNQLYRKIVRAYRREYITPNGKLAVRTQTAHVLTLYFNLAEDAHRSRLKRDLLALIEERGGHLSTGFVGTPYLCPLLTEIGAHDIAGHLLMKSDYPSWLYPVTKGATTMWEHWDGVRTDGTFWSANMNSYNHYAYGAIGEWMMRALAGIDMLEPGYQKLLLHPRPIEELSFVSAWQKTPYGKVRCEWRVNGAEHTVRCTVPAGATAVLVLDDAQLSALTLSGRKPSADMGVIRMTQSDNDVVLELGSGKYVFAWKNEVK